MDGDDNGAFTGALKKVWAAGKFKGNYRNFRDKIAAEPSVSAPSRRTWLTVPVGTRILLYTI